MRKWIGLAAKLYPAAWRRRYGAEFEALIDDSDPTWRDVFNVFGGAIKMQVSTSSFRNVVLTGGVLGLIISTAWAFSRPSEYVSHAMLRITPSQIPENAVPETLNQEMANRINELWQQVATRASLAELIQRPGLDLYRADRARMPLEDVIEQMKKRDITIDILGGKPGAKPSSAFSVSFHYPDPNKAQTTTSALISRLIDVNVVRSAAGSASVSLDLLDPASLPQKAETNRWPFILAGLGLGLTGGVLAVGARRWPLVAASGVAGFVIAGAASFLIPNLYVSHAVLRASTSQQIPVLLKPVLSDDFLAVVIQEENLYANARAGTPLSRIIEEMRKRDLRFDLMPSNAFIISFRSTDRLAAQRVVSRIESALLQPAREPEPFSPANRTMLLLDPPSLPETPVAPNRSTIAGIGMGLGLLAAGFASWIRARRGPALSPA